MARTKDENGRKRNGHGTVYQEGFQKGRPTGFWIAELQFTDESGKERRKSARRRSEREAENALLQFRLELAAKKTIAKAAESRGPTFKDYATKWLALREARVRPATYRQYKGNVDLHLTPFFGQMRVRQIVKGDVAAFITSPKPTLSKAGRKDGTAVRKQCLTTLAMIFRTAVDDGVVERMPFRTTGANKIAVKHDADETIVMTEEQQKSFVKTCTGKRLAALYMLALTSGMREGELLGLRWRDVAETYVIVSRRLDQRTRNREATKTKSSVRRVDLPASMMTALSQHRERMRAEGMRAAAEDLVFVNTVGRPISVTNMRNRDFQKLLTAAGLSTRIRFHDLRHSHAALLLSKGENIMALQKRLGHGDPATTLRYYGHFLPTEQSHAAGVVEALFGKVSPLIVPIGKSPTKPPTRRKAA